MNIEEAAQWMVSIHAPAREATGWTRGLFRPRSGFDPRPREGGDHHTVPACPRRWCFDLRPREGGDP